MEIKEVSLWCVSMWEIGSGWECSVKVVAGSLREARKIGVNIMADRGDILGDGGKKEIRKTSVNFINSGYGVLS